MRTLIVIPLCDYEPITSRVWYPSTVRWIVRCALRSLRRAWHRDLDAEVVLLSDRCSDELAHVALRILRPCNARLIDNSSVRAELQATPLSEKAQHLANQFIKAVELAERYDLFFHCEQDYYFRRDALAESITAFREIPRVDLLSPFDHPDRHVPSMEPLLGRHELFRASHTEWKTVSSTNGTFIWRVPFLMGDWPRLRSEMLSGAIDYDMTNGLYRRGAVLLGPVRSLVQHLRVDGLNASPTFGFCPPLYVLPAFGFAVRVRQSLARRLASPARP